MPELHQAIKKSLPMGALVLCGIATALLYLRFRSLQAPTAPEAAASLMQNFGVLVALLFLVFMGAALAVKKIIRNNPSPTAYSLILIIGFSIVFRLSLLAQTPLLSNDIYRYVWDARVLDHGMNPYLYAPEASELSELRDEKNYPEMSHKYVRTVYPPLLQGLFWVGVKSALLFSVGPVQALKTLFVLFDLLLIFVLVKMLPQLHVDPRWVLLYAWHPLTVIEIAGSGHTDGVGVFFLVAALLFFMRERHIFAAIFCASAFLVKFVSVLLLPFVFFFTLPRGEKKYNWPAVLAFGATILASYLPFMAAGEDLFSGLSVYSAKWRFNDAIFSLCFTPLHTLIPDSIVVLFMIPEGWQITAETLLTRRIDLVLLLTKAIMAVSYAYCYWRVWQNAVREHATIAHINWPRITLTILAAFFLLSPTLQPWYLLWLLPLLILSFGEPNTLRNLTEGQLPVRIPNIKNAIPKLIKLERLLSNRFKIFLWMLSGTVFLSYWVLYGNWREGIWQEQSWVKWVEYGLPSLVFFVPEKYLHRKEAR